MTVMACIVPHGGELQALETLLELDAQFIDAAKPDSLWQMLILSQWKTRETSPCLLMIV